MSGDNTIKQNHQDHESKLIGVVWAAILNASFTGTYDSDGRPIYALMSSEICRALSAVQAFMLGTSDRDSTRSELRKVCDEYAKRLYRSARAHQQNQNLSVIFTRNVSLGPQTEN
jgi:hypothetical protein